MPKWSKDATEFQVKIDYDEEKGSRVRVPKPILEKMDNPDELKFVIDGKNIKVVASGKDTTKKSLSWKEKKRLT